MGEGLSAQHLSLVEAVNMSASPPLEETPVQIIDLYDIVLLLNYERATTGPRFRHAKLREVTTGDITTVRMQHMQLPAWFTETQKIGWVFDTNKPAANKINEPDLPPRQNVYVL